MTRFVGLDIHKHFAEVCVLDDAGRAAYRGRADCRREALERFARERLEPTDRVAIEATTNTWPVAAILRPFVAEVVVGNPLKTRAIAEAKVKTDKVDAEVLAQLLRCDYLPSVWQPDADTQALRSLITHRMGLMTERSRHKNRIQSLVGRLMLTPPCKVLWTKTGLAWLRSIDPPDPERSILASELRQIEAVDRELGLVDRRLAEIARGEPRVRLLMTLPGVSYVVALGLLAALGDVTRFRDGDHAASYLGLVPTTRQSGRKCYHGRITKAGDGVARGLLTQAAQHVARHPGPLGAFYRRLAKRKNRWVAIIAVARKLVTIAHLMLKNGEPYRYAKPDLVAEKFAALDREPDAPGSGGPPPERNGLRSKARDGLAAVYAAAGLPATPPERLPDGERRMLAGLELDRFVRELYSPADRGVRGRPPGRPR